jgi:ATP phosphoribosyltransferase regulatory subunit
LSFTFFARGVRGELGCGGRYYAGEADEPATGFSLFVHNLLRALPAPAMAKRVLVPVATGEGVAADLRSQGWATVAALEELDDLASEARRLKCSHYLAENGPVAVDTNGENE